MVSEKYTKYFKRYKILYLFLMNIGFFIIFSWISNWYFTGIFFFLFILNFIYCVFVLDKLRENYSIGIFTFYISNFIISLILLNHLISSTNPNHQLSNEKIISEYYFTKHISPTPKHNHLQVFREDGSFIYLDCSSITNGHCPHINWNSQIKVEYILLENPYFISKYLFGLNNRRFIYGLHFNDQVYDRKYSNHFFIDRYNYEDSIKKKIILFIVFYAIILLYCIFTGFVVSKNILCKYNSTICFNVFFLTLIHFYAY